MGTLLIYYHLFILLIPWITTGLNTFTTDNDTYWQSTSRFIPTPSISSSANPYGRIRLRQHMKMSLMIQWYGRVSNSPSIYEQIVRLGWPATAGGCTTQNSRYPSLWIDNNQNCFHLSISQDNSCGQGWRISTYTIEKYKIYKIYIEFNDTFVHMTINNTIVLNHIRTSPTRPSFINELMNIYVPSDYWNIPYIIANVSLWNINIQSFNPYTTQVPTDYPTILPTINPSLNPTILPTNNPSTTHPTNKPIKPNIKTNYPSIHPTYIAGSPTMLPTLHPTLRPTKTIFNNIKLSTTSTIIFDFDNNNNDGPKMDTSNLLYLLITGITSCIVGTCLILITIKKCGDFKKNSKKLSAERLSLQMKKINEETIDDCVEVEFEIDGYMFDNDNYLQKNNNKKHKNKNRFSVALKPGKPHVSPIPSYIDNDDDIGHSIEIDNKYIIKVKEPGNNNNDIKNNSSDTEESNITNIAAIEHVMARLNHLNVYRIDEGDGASNDTEMTVSAVGIDGMGDEDETMLTKSETMSPSTRLNMPIRKYLMSESIEEEYIKQLMDQAVVIRNDNNNNNNNNNNYSYKAPKKRLSSLLIISDNEALDGSHNSIDDISNDNDDNKKLEILDDDVYGDDETLPILPGTNTTATLNDGNDGESLTFDYNNINNNIHLKIPYGIIMDGYEWITMALLQIDDEDFQIYLNNFQKNKVNEKRLCDLKRCDMKELIPNIGPRNEFEKLLRIKLGKTLSEIYDNSEY